MEPVQLKAHEPLEAGPFQRLAENGSNLVRKTDKIGRNETFGHVLERLGVEGNQIHEAANAAGQVMDMAHVRPGAELTVFMEQNTKRPVRIEYRRSPTRPRMIMRETPLGYAAVWQEYEPVRSVAAVEGKIKATLWGSAVKLYNLEPELVMKFADLFAYDVDFLTDIQKGDVFRLSYERRYSQGKSLGAGRIHSAQFVNKGKKYELFYFETEDGKGDYYDANGKSHRKMFLRSPLQYRRISSHFSKGRYHPILKIVRPHLGVDYAAPSGTPVETVASGTVTFVGRKGGFGKTVMINHANGYMTLYGHLSKFAKGLKKGQKVNQGDLIAYVGSTGLSTGPHLDFRLKKGKTWVDPLKELKAQSAEPINPKDKSIFLEQVKRQKAEMARLLAARGQAG